MGKVAALALLYILIYGNKRNTIDAPSAYAFLF